MNGVTEIKSYLERREHLTGLMGRGVAIVPTAPERLRNRDSHYSYRFDSYFYYLTGFDEPEAVLVIIAGDAPRHILFCRDKDMEREIWDGFRHGPDAARERFGVDEAYSITRLDELAPKLLEDQPALFYGVGVDAHWDERIVAWLNRVREQTRSGVSAPSEIRDIRTLLDEMRLIKRPEEIALMRRAAAISSVAHRRAMQTARAGMVEFEIEAELLHEFRRNGAQAPAYTSIVAGGANACVLHYVSNNAVLGDGDLLLIDAGCEVDGYASDITRTFPVNGRFSPVQKDVYEMVLAAQQAAIDVARSGHTWDEPHQAALRILAQGMIDLGLCKGEVDGVIESGDYRRFYMHRTGHWLGLDVHDAGEYKHGGVWRELQPGMVLTVEPGCYIRPADDVPKELWNIGIRIEDDVLVTVDGNEVLTAATPKTVSEIESVMQR
jgi:Xaa-Pro aminopeptidase